MQGILGSSVVVGMGLGASASGKGMKYGRRKALLWGSYIGIFGCLVT